MGKKYLNTKNGSLESSILNVWQNAAEELDPVNKKAAMKKFKNRKDKDIDNDGDVDSSDEYLHKRRKAIGKAMAKEYYEVGTDEYRKHTQEVTPGQQIEKYGQFKVQSMREAMHKVWGLDEKKLDKDDKDMIKGKKAMTGGKVANVDMKPEIEEK